MYLPKIISRLHVNHFTQLFLPGSLTMDRQLNRFFATKLKTGNREKRSILADKNIGAFSKSKLSPATVTIHDDDNYSKTPPFAEVDPKNSKLIQMLTACKSRHKRYENMMFMLEGKRLIQEALAADVEPILILFSRKDLVQDLGLDDQYVQPERTIVHHLPYKYIKIWSTLTTSPGLIGVFHMPNLEHNIPICTPLPVTLVCDNIREPGNLGSILRVAAALPVKKVIILSGCVDLWDPKVTRGSCGAMFHLNILTNASWDDVEDKCVGQVMLADHELANEEDIEDEILEEIAEAESFQEDPEQIFDDTDDDDVEKKDANLRSLYKLPLKPYYDISFSKDQSYTIVIGGETEGLSERCFMYAQQKNGIRVNIPLAESVTSLNSATALGIISFEIKRQISLSNES